METPALLRVLPPLIALFASCVARAGEPAVPQFTERVVAGGPDDFMEVRHVVIRGSNAYIGRSLAGLARTQLGVTPKTTIAPQRTREQRAWFADHYPLFVERMRGVATEFGGDLSDDTTNYASLSYGFTRPGCSVVYYPPALTADGVGALGRNFDFTTGTFDGRTPGPDEIPCTSRPFVLELHPDVGYASIALCAYDLMGGVLDGMNDQGLTVALLADDDVVRRFGRDPAPSDRAGLDETEVLRYLLDTCATVAEAKAALRQAPLYHTDIPCHYIIADRHGESFVWENDPRGGMGRIVPGSPDAPLITTNFLLHEYQVDDLPAESGPTGYFNRYRTLKREIAAHPDGLDPRRIKDINRCVAATTSGRSGGRALGRTLWHTLYRPEQGHFEVDFYLGETMDAATGRPVIRRSGYRAFSLEPQP